MKHFEDACYEVARELANLVIMKQKDYGHGNINAFGELGIKVRVNDKKERLRNLLDKINDELMSKPMNEPLKDSWKDIGGYAIIALLLDKGWFDLELRE